MPEITTATFIEASEARATRETDARIHESIYGYSITWIGEKSPRFWSEHGYLDIVPFYTTEIARAWSLAEKFKVSVGPWAGSNSGWVAMVHFQGKGPLASAIADTGQLAICRAVLIAHERGLLQ